MNDDEFLQSLSNLKKKCDYHFFFELQLTFQPMDVLTTQL